MTVVNQRSTPTQVKNLLHRVVGQLNGLEKMIDERRECGDIITQLMAARAALEKVGILILDDESNSCFVSGNATKQKKELQKITRQLFKLT